MKKILFMGLLVLVSMSSVQASHEVLAKSTLDKTDSLEKAVNYPPPQTGVITVATDNAGNPVQMAYKIQGINDGRPVIALADAYFGIDGWKKQQRAFSHEYLTISFDMVGYGLSSKNEPTQLDGVNGQTGYSYRQWASFTHQLMQQLNVQGPITWVGVDTMGQVGMWYVTDYPTGPFSVNKILLESSSPEAIVTDDPCIFGFVDTTSAAQLAAFYGFDPSAALNAFLSNSFATTDCPQTEQELKDKSVAYILTQPSSVFTRIITQTLTEEMSHLMKDITVPVVSIYGTLSDALPIARNAFGVTFFGRQTGRTNPLIPGTCSISGAYIEPFPNSTFHTAKGHTTVIHATARKLFNRILRQFLNGADSRCS